MRRCDGSGLERIDAAFESAAFKRAAQRGGCGFVHLIFNEPVAVAIHIGETQAKRADMSGGDLVIRPEV